MDSQSGQFEAAVFRRGAHAKRKTDIIAARFQANALREEINCYVQENRNPCEINNLEREHTAIAKVAQSSNKSFAMHLHFHRHLDEYIKKCGVGKNNDMGGVHLECHGWSVSS